jgi:hypothetical protein
MHGPEARGRTSDEAREAMRARRMQSLLLVVLFAGSPYGKVLPERPSVLRYSAWFPRRPPEHGGR